jgi:hypothetical protein
MQKKQQDTNSLTLRKEPLRLIEGSKLRTALGGSRIRIPVGYADDGSPIYDWIDAP